MPISNKPISICLLTSSDFPYRGAPENFVRMLSLGLIHYGHSVEIVRYWGNRFGNENDTPIKCSNYLFKTPFKNPIMKIIELVSQVIYVPIFLTKRRFAKRNSIVILYAIDRSYIVFPINIIAKIYGMGCFRIITEYFPPYTYAYSFWRKPLVLFYEAQYKYFDKYLDGVVVLSSYLKNLCINNNVDPQKITIIPNFIDINIPEKESITDKIFTVAFMGYLTVENGIIDLLKANDILLNKYGINLRMVIMGEMLENVIKQIEHLKLNNSNLKFTGHLNKDEVRAELQKCSVLVNPRKSGLLSASGFPTKLGEYFATKKPVVITKVGDLSGYFKNKQEVVFSEPDNPESIADSIKYVYQNKLISAEIGENGYNWAKTNLDYLKNSKRLIEFINNIQTS
jgi:glycosyltransferase involved in cell wall biosynthesis